MKCSVDTCSSPYYSKTFCRIHYQRYRRNGTVKSQYPKWDGIVTERSKKKYGIMTHPLYYTHRGMLSRCSNPQDIGYKYYGAKGIKVCDRWSGTNGFQNFINDMGEKPDKKHSLDRIDNKGDYTPENCRWASHKQQIFNRGAFKNSFSGVKGVIWVPNRETWVAYIHINGKQTYLGAFSGFDEAVRARKDAEQVHYAALLNTANAV